MKRRRFHQVVFALGGAYNLAWGAYSAIDPQWLFRYAGMPPLNHPAIFACLGMVVGVYGLLAHLVARRVPEIGVRLALGARPSEMIWETLRENLALSLTGCAIGLVIAVVGLRVLERFLFGLSPTDLGNLAGAALILVLVSLVAAIVPARRAATVDPLVALRAE